VKIAFLFLYFVFSGVFMANDKYPLVHPIIPVLHPDGEIHDIAMPPDTSLAELHDGLTDYRMPITAKGPTKEGSLEYSPEFKQAAAKAWGLTMHGRLPLRETAFSVNRQGNPGPISIHDSKPGETPTDTFETNSNDPFTLHTHPSGTLQTASTVDKNLAKTLHKTFYVSSNDGLYSVDPGGQVTQVFHDAEWASSKDPK
jgi:hypothetical protein